MTEVIEAIEPLTGPRSSELGVELTTSTGDEGGEGGMEKARAVPSMSDVGNLYEPDKNMDAEDEEDSGEGPCCDYSCYPAELRVRGCGRLLLRFNPFVFFFSVFVIWSFVIWATTDPKGSGKEIALWQTWIVGNFTWLYNGSLVLFMFFSTFLVVSSYGDMKLGHPDDEPEYSLASWFAMLFSAGVGVGLFFFGVGEPVAHFADAVSNSNRYSNLALNEKATAALNLTWFHWGFAASTVYSIVGLPLAFFAHRKKLPMTIRTVFASLYGDDINGVVGDIVDGLAVIGTMFGVATSLGLGVLQLATGLHRVNPNIPDNLDTHIFIIVVVTLMATVSVVSGLDVGIRRLSEGNFIFGLVLLFYLLFLGGTVFQLDLFIQTTGYHFQWLLRLLFQTDAWERDGFSKSTAIYANVYTSAGNYTNPKAWQSWWSVFYWAWWVAWSPFVGLFIATISKGRTVREFILGNVFVPTLFTNIWFTIFGGLGIRMEMASWLRGYRCNSKPQFTYHTSNPTQAVIPPKEFVLLSCRSYTNRLFDLIDSFPLAGFMSVMAIISLTTYFVTSSDSASHVIDVITCNGRKEPPVLQRIFWAFMEGAVAMALLVAGGNDALSALQTASIAAGLPFTFVLLAMMLATYKALQKEQEEEEKQKLTYMSDVAMQDESPDQAYAAPAAPAEKKEADEEPQGQWSTRLCQPAACQCDMNSASLLFGSALCPCVVQVRTQLRSGAYHQDRYETPREFYCANATLVGLLIGSVLLTIIFAGVGLANRGFYAFAGEMALVYWIVSVSYRASLRERYGIPGSIMGDCGNYLCCYTCAVYQEAMQVENLGPSKLAEI